MWIEARVKGLSPCIYNGSYNHQFLHNVAFYYYGSYLKVAEELFMSNIRIKMKFEHAESEESKNVTFTQNCNPRLGPIEN